MAAEGYKPGMINRASGLAGEGFLWSMGGGTFYGPGKGYNLYGNQVLGVFTDKGTKIHEWGGQYWQKSSNRSGILPSPAVTIQANNINIVNSKGEIGSITQAQRGGRGKLGGWLLGQPDDMGKAWTRPTGMAAGFAPALGIGFTSLMMYQGYQENGIGGAMEALYIDVSAGMGVMRNQTKWQGYNIKDGKAVKAGGWFKKNNYTHHSAQARTFMGSTVLGSMSMGIGGYVGASLGAGVGGPLGAAFGGLAGARMARSPLALAASALAIGGGYMLGKGTYQLLKSGYRRKQQRAGLETSGSLAAFNTRQNVTMRQRAVSAIHKSHLNARSALGMEATFMHRDTNYFSTYR